MIYVLGVELVPHEDILPYQSSETPVIENKLFSKWQTNTAAFIGLYLCIKHTCMFLKEFIRLRNINWQDWKYTSFSSVTVKTFDITVQWAETNLLWTSSKTLDWSINSMNREKFCRIIFLKKIQNNIRH